VSQLVTVVSTVGCDNLLVSIVCALCSKPGAWNNTLKQCDEDLTLILIDYNLNEYQELQATMVTNEVDAIKEDFHS